MSDIMAAIGNSQLFKLDEFAKKRRELAKAYDLYFKKSRFFTTLIRDYDVVVPHIYPLIISKEINRNLFQDFLLKKNIQTGIHYKPNHLLSYFSKKDNLPLTNTESIYKNIVTMPLHPDLNFNDLNYIFSSISAFINQIEV